MMVSTYPPTFDGRRTVPSPEVTRIMLDLLALKPGDKLLEIGTGSGYQTEQWARIGCEVHSIELESWVDSTKITGDCVYLHTGDGAKGLPKFAPFDAIVVTCAVENIPKAWAEQLKDSGRLVAPVGCAENQRLTLFHKENSELIPRRIGAYVRFQMMREQPKAKPPKYQPKERYD